MVIDTSAIISVLLNEVTAPRITQAIEAGSSRLLSTSHLVEVSIVGGDFAQTDIETVL